MNIQFTDNSKEISDNIKAALLRGMEKCGLVAEGYAKKLCPVDTGNLRNSITNEVQSSEKAVYIGTNVEYAAYVELGTTRTKAKPYLKPAAAEHSAVYKRIIEEEMGK